MDGVRLVRAAQQALAGAGLGLRTDQPTASQANQRTRGNQSDILAMPVDAFDWQPLQVLDPSSPNFGVLYFLPDYDTPGDTSKIVR